MATPMFCRKCGKRLPAESQFCPTCGAAQDNEAESLTHLPPQSEPMDRGTGRLPTGHLLHQRYRLLHIVGQGGMGAVYVAQDTQLGDRLVAVKEMSMSRLAPNEIPAAAEQFKREAHLLASLQHPNLPVIYEYFGKAERWYLVMSFIQGGTLQSYLDMAPEKKLPVSEVVRIGIELCSVLEYLHTHQPQIIFRDLKPLNIMITPKQQIYLIDFGIARHFKQEQTKDTAYYYSVGYAPPEQYGQSQTGPRSDIYSLGATLYQMLTGHNPASRPFHFPSLQLLAPTVPTALAKLITQMLELDEQQRPASVAIVKEELEKGLKPNEPGEESKKKAGEKKENVPEKKFSPPLDPTIYANNREAQSWWVSTNLFFDKNRRVLWICFIALSAILSVVGGGQISTYLSSSSSNWIAIIGIVTALVGLILFLAHNQKGSDILCGIAFVVLGDSLLIETALLGYIFYESYNYYDFSYGHFPPFYIMFLCTLILLLLGVRFFIRSSSKVLGYCFGLLMILAAIVFIYERVYLYFWYIFTGSTPDLANWTALAQIALGIFVIVATYRKFRKNLQASQKQIS